MKILIVTCTQSKTVEEFKKTSLGKSFDFGVVTKLDRRTIINTGLPPCRRHEIDICVFLNNDQSLAINYNAGIFYAKDADYNIIVFVHDDVSIEDKFLAKKLKKAMETHDVVGLAGATSFKLTDPSSGYNLWHLISKDGLDNSWTGMVAHPGPGGLIQMTNFGPSPRDCKLIDGLFMAVKLKSIAGAMFDETSPSKWHFYDLDFCLTAAEQGLKITTWPIWVVHGSPGLSKISDEFKIGNEWFYDKWTGKPS